MKDVLLRVSIGVLTIAACFAIAGIEKTTVPTAYANNSAVSQQAATEGAYTPGMTVRV